MYVTTPCFLLVCFGYCCAIVSSVYFFTLRTIKLKWLPWVAIVDTLVDGYWIWLYCFRTKWQRHIGQLEFFAQIKCKRYIVRRRILTYGLRNGIRPPTGNIIRIIQIGESGRWKCFLRISTIAYMTWHIVWLGNVVRFAISARTVLSTNTWCYNFRSVSSIHKIGYTSSGTIIRIAWIGGQLLHIVTLLRIIAITKIVARITTMQEHTIENNQVSITPMYHHFWSWFFSFDILIFVPFLLLIQKEKMYWWWSVAWSWNDLVRFDFDNLCTRMLLSLCVFSSFVSFRLVSFLPNQLNNRSFWWWVLLFRFIEILTKCTFSWKRWKEQMWTRVYKRSCNWCAFVVACTVTVAVVADVTAIETISFTLNCTYNNKQRYVFSPSKYLNVYR